MGTELEHDEIRRENYLKGFEEAGRQARRQGIDIAKNPHNPNTQYAEGEAWKRGWKTEDIKQGFPKIDEEN